MENSENLKVNGFQRGLDVVFQTRTAAEYNQCLEEVRQVILTTEKRGSSIATFYNKRYGRTPLSIAETSNLSEVFARYGVEDWRGCDEKQTQTA